MYEGTVTVKLLPKPVAATRRHHILRSWIVPPEIEARSGSGEVCATDIDLDRGVVLGIFVDQHNPNFPILARVGMDGEQGITRSRGDNVIVGASHLADHLHRKVDGAGFVVVIQESAVAHIRPIDVGGTILNQSGVSVGGEQSGDNRFRRP